MAVIAIVLSLIPGPGPTGGNYPFMTPPTGDLLADLIIFSSLIYGISLLDLTENPLRTYLITGVAVLVTGVTLLAVTFAIAPAVYSGAQLTAYVIPYPQTIYPILWGAAALLISPLIWYVQRWKSRAPAELATGETRVDHPF
jgi:hypothetical protein